MRGAWRTLKKTGVSFSEEAGVCRISESSIVPGALSFGFALFAGYILYFRPDIHGEVTPLIWLFRFIFPVGFGLAGLLMLGSGTRTEFRAADGTFTRFERKLFFVRRRDGKFTEVRSVTLEVLEESASGHGDSDSVHRRWRNELAMVTEEGRLRLGSWTWRIEAKRPVNEAAVEARDIAQRLARMIGCPLVESPQHRR